MPKYQFTSPRTGATYDVDFANDPNEADLEEARADLDLREQRTDQNLFQAASAEMAHGALSVPKGIVGGAGAVTSLIPGMEDNFLQRGAEEFEERYSSAIPVDPVLKQTFPIKAAGAVGQGAGFLGTTMATAGLGLPASAVRAIGLGTAGLMGAEQGEKLAETYGVEDRGSRAAMVLGGGAVEAGTEAIGGFGGRGFTDALVNRLRSATMPGRASVRFAKTAGVEGLEEVLAGEGQDLLTKGVVQEDPRRPGFSLNGAPMPPDTISMENLYNRLEEGALGAIGGTVFASAQAIRSRTDVGEALSLRMQAQAAIQDLEKQTERTPEQQSELDRLSAEDQNVAAWLQRRGMETVRPALDQVINNPEVSETERAQAQEYASLIDNLRAAEAAPDATPEEKLAAQQAVENHPLNRINPLARTRQQSALSGAFEQRAAELQRRVDEETRRQRPADPEVQMAQQTAERVAPVAPQAAAALTAITESAVTEDAPAEAPTIESQLGHQGNVQNYQDLLNGIRTWAQANPEMAEEIRNSGGLNAILVGGATDPTRNMEERGDLDWLLQDDTFDRATGKTQIDRERAMIKLMDFLNTIQRGGLTRLQGEFLESFDRGRGGQSQTQIDVSRQLNEALNSSVAESATVQPEGPTATPTVKDSLTVQTDAQVAWEDSPEFAQAEELAAQGDIAAAEALEETFRARQAQTAPAEEVAPEATAAQSQQAPAVQPLQLKRSKTPLPGARVKQSEVQRAAKKLSKLGNVRLATVEELRRDVAFRAMWERTAPSVTLDDWNQFIDSAVATAEGFASDGSGQAVIIPENVVIYAEDVDNAKELGLTGGEAAVMRVMFHENWHGVERWLERDPAAKQLRERYESILSEISPAQLDDLAVRRYPYLSNWRKDAVNLRRLQKEVMAERRENALRTDKPDTLVNKFLAWLKDVYQSITGAQKTTDDQLQDLFDAWYRAQQQMGEEVPRKPEVPSNLRALGASPTVTEKDLTTELREYSQDERSFLQRALDTKDNSPKTLAKALKAFQPKTGGRGAMGYQDQPSQGRTDAIDEQLTEEEGPQFSMPEIPARPQVPVTYQDRGTGNTLEEVLDSLWRPFYAAWESRQTGPLDMNKLAQDWAAHIADPDFLFDKDVEMRIQKRNAGRNLPDIQLPPRELTAPERGARQTRRTVTPVTPEAQADVASRFPQFSQPELTPEQRQARLTEIADRLSYTPSTEQQEGQTPAQATQDQRKYAADGTPVEMYREGVTGVEINGLSKEALDHAIALSPDGPSPDFGKQLIGYLNNEIPTLNGMPNNQFLKAAIALNLEHSPQQRAQMDIDNQDIRKAVQQILSVAGRTLKAASQGRLYEPLRKMLEQAEEQTEKAAKEELGTTDFKELANTANQEMVRETAPLADEVASEEVMGATVDSAQMQADTAAFDLAIESLPPKEQKAVRDLLNELEELDELLRMEAELRASQTGPAASRAEVRGQKLTLAEVQAKIAQKRQRITKLVEDIQKARVEGDPVEAAKKVVKRVRRPKVAAPSQNERLRQWSMGKLDIDGLGKPAATIRKYIQATGLNRDSLTTLLTKNFPEADPNFIQGMVSRMGYLINGVATKEGLLDDIKKGGGKPDPKLVERMVKIADKSRQAKKKAVESMTKKLNRVKNPTPTKLRQRSTFVNSIMGALETGILDSEAVKDAFAQAYDLHGLTQERLKTMGDLLQKIESLPEGMVKETFFNEFNVLLNSIAPTASFITHAHAGLMGYVLSGVTTMVMQLTGVNRFINPLGNTVEILWGAPGTTAEKIGRTMNPRNFFRLYFQGVREMYENLPQVVAGVSGLVSSTPKGLGANPVSLASVVPRQASLSYTPWAHINKYRFNTPKLLKQMGLDKMVQATRYPAWMVSRSFQVIRAAEGIVGGADKNMQWRAQMTVALMQQNPNLTWDKAYSQVSDALGDQTSQMWTEAYKQADEDIAKGLVARQSRKQRATELAQDKLEEQWQARLQNRPRELSALYGYKQDPITPLGASIYNGVSSVLNRDQGPLQALKFSFLFARFFSNAIETAYTRTPLGGLMALTIGTSVPEGKMSDRQKRIVQMFGSLENYKDARMARAVSGTAVMGAVAGLMVMALRGWDPEDDEPPFFWVTGDPLGEFSKKGVMEAGGWWKANTLYIGPVRINYVNSSPELAMVMSAMGSTGDRYLYDKLLNYRENKETGEYERSNFEAYGKPMMEAMAAPISRSTFRQWYDMLEAAYDGNFTKITKAFSNPAAGTMVALSPLGMIPSIKTAERFDRAAEQPRSPQTPAQAAMGSVPFADELGLDAGKPLTTPFGQPLTPYPFWSTFSNSQEVPPEVSQAARLLTSLGVSRLGPREQYFGWGMAEISHDGKKYLLDDAERSEVLQDIGTRFARKLNAAAPRLRKIEAGAGGHKKVRDAISDLAGKARAEALAGFKPSKR